MDRNFVAALAVIAALAGGTLYLLNVGHERELAQAQRQREAAAAAYEAQLAELRKRMEHVEQQAAARAAEARAMAQRAAAEGRAMAERVERIERAAVAPERAAFERAAVAEKAAQERIAAAEKAAREAVVRAAAAERAAAEKGRLAPAPLSVEALFEQAAALEQQGEGFEAVKVYVRAARSGSGRAAKRLGEIYDKGIPGVQRDYAESLKWFNAARVLGEDVPLGKSR